MEEEPLLAPSTGGFIAIYFGWRVVFYTLVAIAGVILALVAKALHLAGGLAPR